MKHKYGFTITVFVAILLIAFPGLAQQKKKIRSGVTLDGASGLFMTWDAEPLRQGEVNFSIGASRYNRDPGELVFHTLPLGFAMGWLSDRMELFIAFDAQKRVKPHWQRFNEPRSIGFYRLNPGDLPIPAATPQGQVFFNNEAPFIDTPVASDRGDVRWGVKINVISERRSSPVGMSFVGFMKVPTNSGGAYLNRGLGTGAISGGVGTLISKRAGNSAVFHLNTMVEWTREPELNAVRLATLQNAFVYRGGVSLPANRQLEFIAEADGKIYYGPKTRGGNPRSPVDFILGIRGYPKDWLVLSAGYRATINHVDEDLAAGIYPAGTNGFVFQAGFGLRRNDPPTVNCTASTTAILQDDTATIRASAVDPDADDLTYAWSSSGGRVTGAGDTITFDATGVAPGEYTITGIVSDGKHEVPCTATITVNKRNEAPTVTCQPSSSSIMVGESATVRASASDPNNDSLTYSWTVNGESLAATGPTVTFGSAGRQPGSYTITATVSDGELTANCSSTVTVLEKPNVPPTIQCVTTTLDVASGETVELRARASDPDGDTTSVSWSASGGRVSGSGETATFNASGLRAGSYTVTATVNDGRGGRASCTMTVNVSQRINLMTGTAGGFRTASSRIDNVAKAALDDIAVQMQNDPRLRANIIGYTDNSRRETRIQDLGARRAQAAADYLQEKGIDASRITATDGGTSNPVGDNSTADGRKLNRRVEVILSVR